MKKHTLRLAATALSITAALTLGTTVSCGQTKLDIPPYVCPTGDEFPIVGYRAFNNMDLATTQNFRIMHDAGFNLSLTWMKSEDELQKTLDAMQGTGIKLFLYSAGVRADIAGSVKKYMGNPAVAGMTYRDEAPVDFFPTLYKSSREFYDTDTVPSQIFYSNLLPNYANAKSMGVDSYEKYIEDFVKVVQIPLLSYDYYPFIEKNGVTTLSDGYYENFEQAASVVKKYGLTLWTFCLSSAHFSFPVPTQAMLSLEAFSGIAYGAQGIQYYTYAAIPDDGPDFHDSPIDGATGKKGAVWNRVRNVNQQIHAIEKYILGAHLVGAWHTGAKIPRGTKRLSASNLPNGINYVYSDGMGVLVSHLQNGSDHYLMIVNRDWENSQKVTVDKAAYVTQISQKGRIINHPSRRITLKPGSWALYKL